ncbi:MAG: imidazole glycerol phosphate synthase subunit HisH [Acidobacteria bacterium]|nr:MAG: imidazole glycerol phosphate synthase subunit HisH [Acidobacteriota bacterium]
MLGVVNYDAGNLKSVETALSALAVSSKPKGFEEDFIISGEPEVLSKADKLVFPGVGEAAQAMKRLKQAGLDNMIRDFALSGKPLLGICLGAQILFEYSHESDTPCLGILPGEVRHFPKESGLKIPHMGWNTLDYKEHPVHPLFQGIPRGQSFYFVHSYYMEAALEVNVIGYSDYGIKFAAAVAQGNVTGLQFHPEKSGPWGLKILENFLKLDSSAGEGK